MKLSQNETESTQTNPEKGNIRFTALLKIGTTTEQRKLGNTCIICRAYQQD